MGGHHWSVEQLSFQHAPQKHGLKGIREQTTPLGIERCVRLDIYWQKKQVRRLHPTACIVRYLFWRESISQA